MATSPDEIIARVAGLQTALDDCDWITKASFVGLHGDLERLASIALIAKERGEAQTLAWLAGGPA